MHRHPEPASVPARWVGAAIAALMLLGAGGCDTGAPPGEGYEIIGFVVESVGTGDDGPPIGGAAVRFASDTGRVAEAVSESNGRFRIFIVSDTRFGEISATAAGFQEARETVFFDSPSRRVDLVLPREGEMPEP